MYHYWNAQPLVNYWEVKINAIQALFEEVDGVLLTIKEVRAEDDLLEKRCKQVLGEVYQERFDRTFCAEVLLELAQESGVSYRKSVKEAHDRVQAYLNNLDYTNFSKKFKMIVDIHSDHHYKDLRDPKNALVLWRALLNLTK